MDTVKNQSITSLPRSPQDDRRARMIKYSLAMGIRMLCILSLLFVHGWWLVVMAIGAIVLPYIAVVLANVGARPGIGAEAPSGREIMVRDPQAPVVVPPAEEESSAQAGDGRFGQPGAPQPYPQSSEWRFPQPGEQQPSQTQSNEWRFHEPTDRPQQPSRQQSSPQPSNEWRFPEPGDRTFPQPGEQSFPRSAARPFDPPAEGQA